MTERQLGKFMKRVGGKLRWVWFSVGDIENMESLPIDLRIFFEKDFFFNFNSKHLCWKGSFPTVVPFLWSYLNETRLLRNGMFNWLWRLSWQYHTSINNAYANSVLAPLPTLCIRLFFRLRSEGVLTRDRSSRHNTTQNIFMTFGCINSNPIKWSFLDIYYS